MNPLVFNACLFVGWAMALAGGLMVHPGWALVGGGASLLVLTLYVARMAGVHKASA